MTTKIEHAKEVLARKIEQAKKYDEREDVTLRDQAIRQMLGDEMGLPTAYVRQALVNAGLLGK